MFNDKYYVCISTSNDEFISVMWGLHFTRKRFDAMHVLCLLFACDVCVSCLSHRYTVKLWVICTAHTYADYFKYCLYTDNSLHTYIAMCNTYIAMCNTYISIYQNIAIFWKYYDMILNINAWIFFINSVLYNLAV